MNAIHDYDASIDYLERLVATPVRNEPGAGLERARLVLAHAGNPHLRFATLHVTGSSGKGSTSALAAGMLRAGYRIGVFSSPHLEEYTERIAVDGTPIARADWTRLLNRLRPFVERMADGTLPSYTLGRPALLQVLWPLAALYFAERGVEIAVVEVGMGGRYDSTNANSARVAVITNVSLEHTQHLGGTIAEIAHHKAGVARPGGILVTAAQHPEALRVIAEECALTRATLWRVAPDDAEAEVSYAVEAAGLSIRTPVRAHSDLALGMAGRHQYANAACAVAAVDALESLGVAAVSAQAVRRGLAETRVPGRMERVADDPLTILDGAHNPDAARALAVALRELFPDRRVVLLLGILGDKDIAAMVDALAPLAQAVVVTEPPWQGRMGKAGEVAVAARRHLADVRLVPAVDEALAAAQGLARQLDAPLIIAGSLILAGAVRPLLRAIDGHGVIQ